MKPLHNTHFIKFIVYFNENQDFFECHEELEEYWKSIPNSTKGHPLTAYILLSTGMYHWRRGNTIGGLRTLKKANEKFDTTSEADYDFTVGIDFKKLRENVQQAIRKIENNQPFKAFPIIIKSEKMSTLVSHVGEEMELLPFGSDAVIHKHIRRDRSSIIQLRDEKKKSR